MANAYYSSGERDEDGVFVLPKPWDDAVNKMMKSNITKNPQPQPDWVDDDEHYFKIDFDFFKLKKNKFNPKSREYWDWAHFINYAYSSVKLYAQAMSAFYKVYLNQHKTFGYNESIKGLKASIEKQNETEGKLARQFLNRGQDADKFFNKYAKVRTVVDLSAEAWTIVHALSNKCELNASDISMLMDFSSRLRTAVLSNAETAKVNLYRLGHIARWHIRKSNLPELLMREHPGIIYWNKDASSYLDELISLTNGVKTKEVQSTIDKARNDINESGTNEERAYVKFYDARWKMEGAIKVLSIATKDWEEGKHNVGMFNIVRNDVEGEDSFVVANKYLDFCKKILPTIEVLGEKYVRDVQEQIKKLSSAIAHSKQAHEEYEIMDEELTRMYENMVAKFKIKRGNKTDRTEDDNTDTTTDGF